MPRRSTTTRPRCAGRRAGREILARGAGNLALPCAALLKGCQLPGRVRGAALHVCGERAGGASDGVQQPGAALCGHGARCGWAVARAPQPVKRKPPQSADAARAPQAGTAETEADPAAPWPQRPFRRGWRFNWPGVGIMVVYCLAFIFYLYIRIRYTLDLGSYVWCGLQSKYL